MCLLIKEWINYDVYIYIEVLLKFNKEKFVYYKKDKC